MIADFGSGLAAGLDIPKSQSVKFYCDWMGSRVVLIGMYRMNGTAAGHSIGAVPPCLLQPRVQSEDVPDSPAWEGN